jgi:hypothetical protein
MDCSSNIWLDKDARKKRPRTFQPKHWVSKNIDNVYTISYTDSKLEV